MKFLQQKAEKQKMELEKFEEEKGSTVNSSDFMQRVICPSQESHKKLIATEE